MMMAPLRGSTLCMTMTAVLSSTRAVQSVGAFSFLSPQSSSWASSAAHVIEHLISPPLQVTPLQELANTCIPGPPGSNIDILAYKAMPSGSGNGNGEPLPSLILIHEFFGLNPSIVEKAQALTDDLGCIVVAPDTFRGDVTDFIPKAIWLALSTPQKRVNDDLDAVCSYLNVDSGKVAVMGFCYGGGKAMRYTSQRRPDAATVVFYGSPLTNVEELRRLRAPVCGVYGSRDAQFPLSMLDKFRESLKDAGVENEVRIYDGVGHAFWTNMDQIKSRQQPQRDAYELCTAFLRKFFGEDRK